MTTGNKIYENTIEWKNWLQFINDTHTFLREIEEIGVKSYYDPNFLTLFFSKLSLFCHVRSSYIKKYEDLKLGLESCEERLFSNQFLLSLENNVNNSDMRNKCKSINKYLLLVLQKVCADLTDAEILPKPKKKLVDEKQKEDMEGVGL